METALISCLVVVVMVAWGGKNTNNKNSISGYLAALIYGNVPPITIPLHSKYSRETFVSSQVRYDILPVALLLLLNNKEKMSTHYSSSAYQGFLFWMFIQEKEKKNKKL